MSAITYKCPNCPASLRLDPETQKFVCDYCGSSFTLEELTKKEPAKNADDFQNKTRLYHCQSCGAEVFTDDTTAATFCIYCHNPVVLSGELEGAMKPDQVIPFKVSKEEVKSKLMAWCKKKKFIDSAFIDSAQLEKLSGVYFPYFIVDGKVQGSMHRRGTKIRTWQQGNYRYTQTDTYQIDREGEVAFEDIPINALNKDHTYILNGIQPFDQKKAVAFQMPYLSGFLADKRNIEKEDAMPTVQSTAEGFTRARFNASAQGYVSFGGGDESYKVTKTVFSYVLMPAWMLTYQYGKDQYFFAMNGDSGKIAGRVPLSAKKLRGLFFALTAIVSALMVGLGAII